jgi:peroxidase
VLWLCGDTDMGVLRGMGASLVAVLVVLSLVTAPGVDATRGGAWDDGGLQNGFYLRSCPNVESIIFQSMQASYNADNSVAPGVLRLAYHDCFVRGCDASVLLDGPGLVEKNSSINAGLHGFPAIDAAKEAVESACPGVVSCSDVLQFAVRDTVILTGGQGWAVPSGRRDGRVSKESEVAGNLMTPDKRVPVLLKAFQKKGLDAAQMVALAGAHTIGKASCFKFDDRLHGKQVDPTELEKQCPVAGIVKTTVSLDLVSPTRFDTQYFKNILNKLGLLTSDQSMLEDSRTAGQVQANTDASTFSSNFASAMVALSKVSVLTGNQGEIRRQCRIVN